MNCCPACGYERSLAEQQNSPDKCTECGVYFAKILAKQAYSESQARKKVASRKKSVSGQSGKVAAVAVLIVCALIYIFASPYIAVNKLKTAAETRNAADLSEQIDFPALRQSVKDQLSARIAAEAVEGLEDNPFAAFGAALAGSMVGVMVDAYVTPAGIAQMMKGGNPSSTDEQSGSTPNDEQAPFASASMGYQGINKFVVTVPNETGEEAHFVLRRNGVIGWRLTDLIIPID